MGAQHAAAVRDRARGRREWTARSHEIRDLLGRTNVPHGFYLAASDEGQRLLGQSGVSDERLPVLVLFDGRTLVNPTNAE